MPTFMLYHPIEGYCVPWLHGRLRVEAERVTDITFLAHRANYEYGGTAFHPCLKILEITHRDTKLLPLASLPLAEKVFY